MIEASQHDRVLHLALNRPEKRNALNTQLCRALLEAFAQANADPSIGAILLSGNGPSFCAGMDLQEASRNIGEDNFADLHEKTLYGHRACPKADHRRGSRSSDRRRYRTRRQRAHRYRIA